MHLGEYKVDLEWLRSVWPIAAALAAIGVRVEVNQATNRQAIDQLRKLREEDRDDTKAMFKEIRADLKEIRNGIMSLPRNKE